MPDLEQQATQVAIAAVEDRLRGREGTAAHLVHFMVGLAPDEIEGLAFLLGSLVEVANELARALADRGGDPVAVLDDYAAAHLRIGDAGDI
jgi:hypothetical protein